MAEQNTPEPDRSKDGRWAYNPISRRYILRTGAVYKRLVKSGVVQDEEVAEQLARPAQGTPRKRHNNVSIKADQDAVSGIVRDHFDASRLTGAQLQQIAAEVARLSTSGAPKTRSRGRKPQYRSTTGLSHRSRAPPPTSEDDNTCDESLEETETTATESDALDPRAVARDVSARLSTIRVSKPPLRRR